MPGTLYLVATPIGIWRTSRCARLRILREADLVACEDTRQTRKLLDHYGIHKATVSYHEHNEAVRATELIEKLDRVRAWRWSRTRARRWSPIPATGW